MRCRMSVHANSIYPCIYTGHKKLLLYLSAEWRLAPIEQRFRDLETDLCASVPWKEARLWLSTVFAALGLRGRAASGTSRC